MGLAFPLLVLCKVGFEFAVRLTLGVLKAWGVSDLHEKRLDLD